MKIKISGFTDEKKQIAALANFVIKTYSAKAKETSKGNILTTWLEVRPPVKKK